MTIALKLEGTGRVQHSLRQDDISQGIWADKDVLGGGGVEREGWGGEGGSCLFMGKRYENINMK